MNLTKILRKFDELYWSEDFDDSNAELKQFLSQSITDLLHELKMEKNVINPMFPEICIGRNQAVDELNNKIESALL